jgi:acyl-CoA reductase-like NAD-dependent aldehyde dehydrogenase
VKVIKTLKMYVGGEFIRSESGRSYELLDHAQLPYARLCHGSRKDLRNTVEVAKAAGDEWQKKSAFNRGQILYRMAEMTAGKTPELVNILQVTLGIKPSEATQLIEAGIDQLVYYAGFCDKFQQVLGAVNPINGPFHNFTTPDAMGVVMLFDQDEFNFSELMANLASILVGGNAMIVLLGKGSQCLVSVLGEILATSDLPKGVVNLLTGDEEELLKFAAEHREIRSLSYQKSHPESLAQLGKIKSLGIDNMKRIYGRRPELGALDKISQYIEFKSVWHPIGV